MSFLQNLRMFPSKDAAGYKFRSLWRAPRLCPVPNWSDYYGIPDGKDKNRKALYEAWEQLERPVAVPWVDGTNIFIEPKVSLFRPLVQTGLYEPGTALALYQALPEKGVFLDIGANIGVFSILASKWLGPKGRVVAVEPSPRERKSLHRNLALNTKGAPVTIVSSAISDTLGTATMLIAESENGGLNTIGSKFAYSVPVAEEITVFTTKIDTLVENLNLPRVDVIKLDIEGMELHALIGAIETLKRFRPVLIVEILKEALEPQGVSTVDIQDWLEGMGYSIFIIDDGKENVLPVGRLPLDASCNILAKYAHI